MASNAVQSSLQIYLKEINRTPLLNAEEEKSLARNIIDAGCLESRDTMIRANLRLVVAIAKRYNNRGLALTDLIEEGNIGLCKAVENFNPDMGARFSTYGSWWIKQAIKRALINAVQPIHVPAYMVELIAKWKRAHRKLEDKLGRQPSINELAEEMQLPVKKVRVIRKAVKVFQRPSQSTNKDHGDGLTLADIIEDETAKAPDHPMELREEIESIHRLLDIIDERDATILRLRYGLGGQEPMTLKEIGQHVGLTRERVRQLEILALKKLHKRINPDAPLDHTTTRREGNKKTKRPDKEHAYVTT